jgi:hypothetical protein
MEKVKPVEVSSPTEEKSDQSRHQNQQGQAHLHQFREISQ